MFVKAKQKPAQRSLRDEFSARVHKQVHKTFVLLIFIPIFAV